VNQLYRFRSLGVEEIRGTVGGLSFPLVHDWTYRGTECAEEEKPFLTIQAPPLLDHGTSPSKELETSIRGTDGNESFAIDPVAGCKSISSGVVVYDRKDVREIAFENLMSEYKAGLVEAIRAAGTRVKLRGVNDWAGNGDCSVNLMWAAR
jgi:hypothetical protein